MLRGFSREYDYPRYRRPPEGTAYCQGRLARRICLPDSAPTPFNALFRQRAAVPLLRHPVAPAPGHGILTVLPSAAPFGWALGTDSPRADWHGPGNLGLAAGGNRTPLVVTYTYICFSGGSTGGRPPDSRPPECSPTGTFIICYPAPSAPGLYPIIIHASPLDQ